jgi:short subunit dehydrogenase-like uncharacterized protein
MRERRGEGLRHDVVIWGATGFTGRLVAEYLSERAGGGKLRLALAGRDRGKLELLREELVRIEASASELPLIVADSHDRASLDAMVRETAVVCSTVGPYALHGRELVAACVEAGVDYCDLTGEVQFIRAMIEEHHAAAERSGARIVHCCGFDSIPSDLGTWMLQQAAIERHGAPLDRVTFVLGASRGSFSGGTVASMINVVSEAGRDRETRRVLSDPYALNPEGERSGPDRPDLVGARFDRGLGRWTGPFVMASINTRIVRRSNAILGWPYGRDFCYSEVTGFGAGFKGRLAATATAAGLGAFVAALAWSPTRSVLSRLVLPKPGEGPDRAEREAGYFKIRLHGNGTSSDGRPVEMVAHVAGEKDPGYGETAKMLGESAFCLAIDGDRLTSPGGILTPAAAMGGRLVERLRAAGMRFEVP